MSPFDLRLPELAYLFGFLQADGHLSKGIRNKGRVTVELNIRDVEVLDRFRELIPAYTSVGIRTRDTNFKNGCRTAIWRLYDRDLRGLLNELGLPYGKKSDIVAPPEAPFSEPDYFRGFFDGDGSLGYTSIGLPFVSLPTASLRMASAFEMFWYGITGKHKVLNPNKRDGLFNLMVTKEGAQAIVRTMYYPGCLALVRKMDSARKVLEWLRPDAMTKVTWDRRRWSPQEDAYILSHAVQESVYTLGRTEKSIRVRTSRLRKQDVIQVRSRAGRPEPLHPSQDRADEG